MKATHVLRGWLLVLTLAAGFSLAACATESPPSNDPTAEVDEDTSVDDTWEEDEPFDGDSAGSEPVEESPEQSEAWVCEYSPTMDHNWHNDVLCSNGTQQQRPYLRPDDSFITEDEIMASAKKYERQLNGQ